MNGNLRIEKLARSHDVDGFVSGSEPLDRFLVRHALLSQQANASQTYVAVSDDRVVGYYTLVFGQVSRDIAPPRIARDCRDTPCRSWCWHGLPLPAIGSGGESAAACSRTPSCARFVRRKSPA